MPKKATKTENPQIETVEVAEAVETVEAKEEVEEVKTGVVTGCSKLNVRKEAKIDAAIVCAINDATKVTVHKKGSTKDWFKVSGKDFEGFCMKKFIKIKA